MKKNMTKLVIFFCTMQLPLSGIAQEILTKSRAVEIALSHNFDIRAIENDLSVSKNNQSYQNSGFLPSLTGNAGADYSRAFIPTDSVLRQADTKVYSAGLHLDYTIFNGFGRRYNYTRLKEEYKLTELQAKAVMENTLLNLFTVYYEIARLRMNEISELENLAISKQRLKRAQYSYEYAQTSKLDVLNAEVDFNNDSIQYLRILQQLVNQKHHLNLLLGRDIATTFEVDTTLVFASGLTLESTLEAALVRNSDLLQQESTLRNTDISIKAADARAIPEIGVYTSYGWSNTERVIPFQQNFQSHTIALGASLRWNIWDGGISNTQKQNARLAKEKQQVLVNKAKISLEKDLADAWTDYQTAQLIMSTQQKSMSVNEQNFERTKDNYALGRVTNIAFREAQSNLLAARISLNSARFDAKMTELVLLRLSGRILESEF